MVRRLSLSRQARQGLAASLAWSWTGCKSMLVEWQTSVQEACPLAQHQLHKLIALPVTSAVGIGLLNICSVLLQACR